jgi:energy-coupling factor transporter transmembrane protein EcfT
MEKIYGTYKPPQNPYIVRIILLFVFLGVFIIGVTIGLISVPFSIALLLLSIILGVFFFYKYFAYAREWVKENVKCPVCKGSISKVSGYGGGKHSRMNGFILHCESCNKDFALAFGPNEWVLQDINPSLVTVLRATFFIEEMIGLAAFSFIFLVLLGILVILLFFEITFHTDMFNPNQPPVKESNLTLAKENLCSQSGGGILTMMCCSQVKFDDFPNTCVVDFEKACGCGIFSPSNPVKYCKCGPGKCWDTDKNECVTAPMPSNQSH